MKKFLIAFFIIVSFIIILPVAVLVIIFRFSKANRNDEIFEEIETKDSESKKSGNKIKIEEAISDSITSVQENISDRQKKILKLLGKFENIDMSKIASTIKDVSERTLRRDLSKLEELGMILKEGETKGATYSLRK